jgi:Do/DeqQ family serine protease
VKEDGALVPLDFTGVSKEVMNSVVHITSTREVSGGMPFSFDRRNPLEDFFGEDFFRHFYGNPRNNQPQRSLPEKFEQKGTGSGVIISSNGYIVTNNHVVDQATEVEVTLHNNKVYKARVVGTDPATDIAVLQIKSNDLPAIALGDPESVEVGEWVLAIGNPFNLDATVTAGIVSAKGRNINIIDDQSAIEAFIQTDAAINPGNSGGALVNLNGELIGINTAIASPTGSYAGYGFAIPVSIVNKVVGDIMQYGMVQRGYLGILIRDINGELVEAENLKVAEGVYVDSLMETSAAGDAGLKEGDVITSINGVQVKKTADLLEQVGIHRPGDEVKVIVDRNGREMRFDVVLANRKGTSEILARNEMEVIDQLGATFKDLSRSDAEKLGIEGGVKIESLSSGILKSQTQLKPGFIITAVNNQEVNSVEELEKILEKTEGGVLMEGFYKDYPGKIYVAFGLDK